MYLFSICDFHQMQCVQEREMDSQSWSTKTWFLSNGSQCFLVQTGFPFLFQNQKSWNNLGSPETEKHKMKKLKAVGIHFQHKYLDDLDDFFYCNRLCENGFLWKKPPLYRPALRFVSWNDNWNHVACFSKLRGESRIISKWFSEFLPLFIRGDSHEAHFSNEQKW